MRDSVSRGKLIAEMDANDRPREKALSQGFDRLTDAELLAIIFATGTREKSVLELSSDILRDCDYHMSKLVSMGVSDIVARYKGIGPAKAITLLAALQLGIRAAADAAAIDRKPIKSAEDIYRRISARMQWLHHEEFWVLYLSRSNEVIYEYQLSKGGMAATVVDVRIIMRFALEKSAASIILVHNHPSGNLSPSMEDQSLTQKVSDAAKFFDISVLDHIIISHSGYYSFRDHGLI